MQSLIRTASLRGFEALVIELGRDPVGLLERFDIEPEASADEDGLVSITAHDRMLDAAADTLRCPDFGGGHIINIASLAGLVVPGEAVYAASKHAVMGFFRSSTAADLRVAGWTTSISHASARTASGPR